MTLSNQVMNSVTRFFRSSLKNKIMVTATSGLVLVILGMGVRSIYKAVWTGEGSITVGMNAASASTSSAAEKKKPTVIVQDVKAQTMSDRLVYPGRVRSKVEAQVNSENEGQVKQILKPVGSLVGRGEPVLRIQNSDPIYKFAPVTVVAPATGYLARVDVSLHSKVEKGMPLFLVTDPKSLQVEVEIPAAELGFFKIGEQGLIQLGASSDNAPEAALRIVGLSPLVDPKTGTATAQLEFSQSRKRNSPELQNQLSGVRPGMIVQVAFDVNKRSAVVLPSSSLVYREGKPHIRVLEGQKSHRIPVEIRAELGGSVELKSEIEDGTKVITRANRFISDGEEVELEATKTE